MLETANQLNFPTQESKIIDLNKDLRDRIYGKEAIAGLPVVLIRVVGNGQRTSELDLFEETVYRLIRANVSTVDEMHGLIGLEKPLIESIVISLANRELIKVVAGQWHFMEGELSFSIDASRRKQAWLFFDPICKAFLPFVCSEEPTGVELLPQQHKSGRIIEYQVGSEGGGRIEKLRIDRNDPLSIHASFEDIEQWRLAVGELVPLLRRRHGFVSIEALQPTESAWFVVRLFLPARSQYPQWQVQDPVGRERSEALKQHIERIVAHATDSQAVRIEPLLNTLKKLKERSQYLVEGEHHQQLSKRAAEAKSQVQSLPALPQAIGDGLLRFHYDLLEADEVEGQPRTERISSAYAIAWAAMEEAAAHYLASRQIDVSQLGTGFAAEILDPEPTLQSLREIGWTVHSEQERELSRFFRVSTSKLQRTLRGIGNHTSSFDLPSLWYILLQEATGSDDAPLKQLCRACPEAMSVLADLQILRNRGAHSNTLSDQQGQHSNTDQAIRFIHCWVCLLGAGALPNSITGAEAGYEKGPNQTRAVAGRLRAQMEQEALRCVSLNDPLYVGVVELLCRRSDLQAIYSDAKDATEDVLEQSSFLTVQLSLKAVEQCYVTLERLSREWLERWQPLSNRETISGHDCPEACYELGLPIKLNAAHHRIQSALQHRSATMMAQVCAVVIEAAADPRHPLRNLIVSAPQLLPTIQRIAEERDHLQLGRIPPSVTTVLTFIEQVLMACRESSHLFSPTSTR